MHSHRWVAVKHNSIKESDVLCSNLLNWNVFGHLEVRFSVRTFSIVVVGNDVVYSRQVCVHMLACLLVLLVEHIFH